MNRYVATFHTHVSALMTCQALKRLRVAAHMAPVPRKLSSSCGTCLFYEAEEPHLDSMNEDVEDVYHIAEEGVYQPLYHND